MSDAARSIHDEAAVRLHGAGQRYTDQRRRLIEILSRAGSPMSIPEILRGRRGLPQSTVYRNLSDLETAGVVRRIVTDEEFDRYELTEELTGHHHHLFCAVWGTSDVGSGRCSKSSWMRRSTRSRERRASPTSGIGSI
jgi:Fe2+ or Zn2+ uptake regulation protein